MIITRSQAEQFAELVLPWDDKSFVNVHMKSTTHQGLRGQCNLSLREFADAVRFFGEKNNDIYCCMSSQRRKGDIGKSAARSQIDAVALKSLWYDIDVKPKQYETLEDAQAALADFVKKAGLPAPNAIVHSGGGMHVHWALEKALHPRDWQPLADAMVKIGQHYGLMFDAGVTIDSARILRVPGTQNHKLEQPRPVTLASIGKAIPNALMEMALQPFVISQVSPFENGAGPGSDMIDDNHELGGGVQQYQAIDLDKGAEVCPWLANTLATRGANDPEPLWMMALMAATHTANREASAERVSDGHPRYDKAATIKKMERFKVNGWPKCQTIATAGCDLCKTCPHLSAGKTPFHHVKRDLPATNIPAPTEDAPPEVTQPDNFLGIDSMPATYSWAADGTILKNVVVEEDQSVASIPVLPYPILDAWMQRNPWRLHFSTRNIHKGTSKVQLDFTEIQSKDVFVRQLAHYGMMMQEEVIKNFRSFLVSWTAKLQTMKDAVIETNPFGWVHVGSKMDGFSYGGTVHTAHGTRPAAVKDNMLHKFYAPQGDIEHWIAAAKIITDQRRPELDAILAASFGAPLTIFTGHCGWILSGYSTESGIGKTTTMKIATAVWGDPVKAKQGLIDTPKSVYHKAGQLKHLPIFWDEIKGEEQFNAIAKLAFQISEGKEGSRLRADVSMQDMGDWQTGVVIASNDSLLDAINRASNSTTAGLYRLFEFIIPPPKSMDGDEATVTRSVAKLNQHFGRAGEMYAKFLGENFAGIETNMKELQESIKVDVGSRQDERFWMAAFTCVYTGACYANEIGLTDFDLAGLYNFLVDSFKRMRGELKEAPSDMKSHQSISGTLQRFFSAMRSRHTLITNEVHKGAGRPAPGKIQSLTDIGKLDDIAIHVGRDDGIIRISSVRLTKWLDENKLPRRAFTKALAEEFGAVNIKAVLGGGVIGTAFRENLIELNIADARLKQFME